MTHYDLIVIGSGPAGEKGAAQAAYFGKRVAIVEQAPEVGGTGINTGTIPSKTLRESALYFSGLQQRGLCGVDHRVTSSRDPEIVLAAVAEAVTRIKAADREKHKPA